MGLARDPLWRPRIYVTIGVVIAIMSPVVFVVLIYRFEGATWLASVLASIGVSGSFLTLAGLFYTILQTLEAKRVNEQLTEEIGILTETRPVASSADILHEFMQRVRVPDACVTHIYFLANTIAVGATAKDADFSGFCRTVDELLEKLGGCFHLAYVKIDPHPEEREGVDLGVRLEGMSAESRKRLLAFYNQEGYTNGGRLELIIRDTYRLHRSVVEHRGRYHPLSDALSDGPHFILINPSRKDRLGIIWNIRRRGVGPTGEVVTVGFRTTNEQIIKVMISIFEERTNKNTS